MKAGFVGCGKMGEAIMASLIRSRAVRPCEVFVSDAKASRRRALSRRYKVNVSANNAIVASRAQTVFLAVKPQELNAVLDDISAAVTGRHLVISIAAGRRLSSIESRLPRARAVRVMPNLPALVSEGMSVFCAGSRATAADRKRTVRLLSCFGRVLELPESHFDTVTALSGSGPAFFAYVLDAVVRAAVGQGLARKQAKLLAEQTMLGTAKLLMQQHIDPLDLVRAVASPKGTTEAGLKVLEPSSVAKVLERTIAAAAVRSRELSRDQ